MSTEPDGNSAGTNEGRPTSREQISGHKTGIARIELLLPRRKQLTYAVVGQMALFEGDIALGTLAEVSGDRLVPMGVGIRGDHYRWPGGVLPYEVHSDLPAPERVREAIKRWQASTKLRFVELTAGNAPKYEDYVSFEAVDGCWSYVGRRGRGKQIVSVGVSCSMGNVMHEIGHAVGLWHEQSRADRDKYVKVEWDNIRDGDRHNFEQHIFDGDDLGNYDFESIMHYPADAFSKNGKPTLVPSGGQNIGQRTRLSAGDRAAVELLYPNS